MNIYTRNLQTEPVQQAPGAGELQQKPAFFRVILLLGCICVVFFCAIALRVFLTAKIERMNKNAARINTRIREYEILCYHLRNKKASLTSMNYVNAKVREYGLKLRAADYRQVRNVVLLPERNYDRSISPVPDLYSGTRGTAPKEIHYAKYRRNLP
jgi:hypothetical protein